MNLKSIHSKLFIPYLKKAIHRVFHNNWHLLNHQFASYVVKVCKMIMTKPKSTERWSISFIVSVFIVKSLHLM